MPKKYKFELHFALIFAKIAALMKARQTHETIPNDRLFLAGFGLFVIGALGAMWQWWSTTNSQLPGLIGQEALAYIELNISRSNANFLESRLGQTHIESLSNNMFGGASIALKDLKPWIGKKGALIMLPENRYIIAAKYRSKSKAKTFLETFTLEGEDLKVQNSDLGEIYTPAFSSQRAFLFYKGWLLWADSPKTLLTSLTQENRLKHFEPYRDLRKDLPTKTFGFVYANLQDWDDPIGTSDAWQVYKPLFKALGETIPQLAGTLALEGEALQWESKFLIHEKAYDENHTVLKSANKTIPDLAYFVPKNALFFVNGSELYKKYLHTKNFLGSIDPQLRVVFEGVLRAQSNRIFGENFDYEADFLALMEGPYAFVIDFNTVLEVAFISGVNFREKGERLEKIKSVIQSAQSRFAPVVEAVELPDGSTREELVAVDPASVPIVKKLIEDQEYFVAETSTGDQKFSYAVLEPHFVIANQENILQNIIETKAKVQPNLSENADFRESVLFNFSAAESYGYLNFGKFNQMTQFWESLQVGDSEKSKTSWLTGLGSPGINLRNMTFARVVYEGEVFLKAFLFLNK